MTKLLRHIYISIDDSEVMGDCRRLIFQFNLQTRSLCSFLEKKLTQAKFSANFSSIIFNCIEKAEPGHLLMPKDHLIINVPIKLDNYYDLNLEELNQYFHSSEPQNKGSVPFPFDKCKNISIENVNEYFIGIIQEGLKIIKGNFELPYEDISNGIKEFREKHYQNSWKVGPKRIKGTKATCQVSCKVTIANFLADFEVMKDGNIVYSENIYSSLPDEFIYHGACKKLIVKDDIAIVSGVSGAFQLEQYKKNLRGLFS